MTKRNRIPTLKQMEKEIEKIEHQKKAWDELHVLYRTWLEEASPAVSQRTMDAIYREVRCLDKEIEAGKSENIAERFTQAMERAIAASLPKKRVTFLRTIDALEELTALSRTWYQATSHSKQDQAEQLRKLRLLLLEVAAGHIEDLTTRFEQGSMSREQDRSIDEQNHFASSDSAPTSGATHVIVEEQFN